ncbi:MAG: hypothetical protein Q4E07_01970 [Eubacteriales bacterium]|nr:hypothetical protein [Eubacteriales bacterium]
MNKAIENILNPIQIPDMGIVRQGFDKQSLGDIPGHIKTQFSKNWVKECVKENLRIGITVGSRGISNLLEIVKALSQELKSLGAQPFILPSMGSHGGATAAGQKKILEELGITEESTGAQVLSNMEVVNLGDSNGIPTYYDKIALSLDGVIVLNRIKAHTDLEGDIESGFQKIIAVGLGNHKGALVVHEQGLNRSVPRIQSIAKKALEKGNILFGVGVIENAYDNVNDIVFVPRDKIIEQEPELLRKSKALLPSFHFNDIDVLVVDWIGKNISGDGMDPNIIGRSMIGQKNKNIRINQIVTLAVTEESKGSGVGVGLSDVTTRRMADALDFEAMYINTITAIAIKGASLPIALDSDRAAIQLALKVASVGEDPLKSRMARIKDTLHMGEIWVSKAIFDEIASKDNIEVVQEPKQMVFDDKGNLELM